MTDDMMSEWQPGIITPVHLNNWPDEELMGRVAYKRVLVTEVDNPFVFSLLRDIGCDAKRLLQVVPEDAQRLLQEQCEWYLCEHEILTD